MTAVHGRDSAGAEGSTEPRLHTHLGGSDYGLDLRPDAPHRSRGAKATKKLLRLLAPGGELASRLDLIGPLLADGLSHAQIAARIGRSEAWVSASVEAIRNALNEAAR